MKCEMEMASGSGLCKWDKLQLVGHWFNARVQKIEMKWSGTHRLLQIEFNAMRPYIEGYRNDSYWNIAFCWRSHFWSFCLCRKCNGWHDWTIISTVRRCWYISFQFTRKHPKMTKLNMTSVWYLFTSVMALTNVQYIPISGMWLKFEILLKSSKKPVMLSKKNENDQTRMRWSYCVQPIRNQCKH